MLQARSLCLHSRRVAPNIIWRYIDVSVFSGWWTLRCLVLQLHIGNLRPQYLYLLSIGFLFKNCGQSASGNARFQNQLLQGFHKQGWVKAHLCLCSGWGVTHSGLRLWAPGTLTIRRRASTWDKSTGMGQLRMRPWSPKAFVAQGQHTSILEKALAALMQLDRHMT